MNASLILNYSIRSPYSTRQVDMTPTGYKYTEQIIGKGLFDLADPWAFYIINALKAKELFSRDKVRHRAVQCSTVQYSEVQCSLNIVVIRNDMVYVVFQ